MRTFAEYKERLYSMRKNVYLGGKLRGRDDDLLKGGINVVGVTFDKAQDPEYQEYCTATSHLSGETINRFNHIYQNEQDLMLKRMTQPCVKVVGDSALHGR